MLLLQPVTFILAMAATIYVVKSSTPASSEYADSKHAFLRKYAGIHVMST